MTESTDAEHLAAAIEIIRAAVPDAVSAELQTSDQDTYGFILTDVAILGGDDTLADVEPERLYKLRDDVFDHLCNLEWDGVVGENGFGTATVAIMSPKEQRIREAEAEYLPDGDAYGDRIDIENAKRYLLVESNERGSSPPYHLTTHDSPQEAWDYRVTQEYPSDWGLEALIDLGTGDTYDESDFLVTVTLTRRGGPPRLAEQMREAIAPLIALRDLHLDPTDNIQQDEAAIALDRAFDYIDSAISTLENAEEGEPA